MIYQVILSRLAVDDLAQAHEWAVAHAPLTADKWLSRFQEVLATLSSQPRRCPLAREDKKVPLEIRELHFGARPNVFRVVFTVEVGAVRVLRIRRAQRRFLTRGQIEETQDD